MLLVFCLCAWVSRLGEFADQRSEATVNHFIDTAATEAISATREVPDQLSADHNPLNETKPARAQILHTDQQYLVLPRMLDPYPDIAEMANGQEDKSSARSRLAYSTCQRPLGFRVSPVRPNPFLP
jgi:hypothetical protein